MSPYEDASVPALLDEPAATNGNGFEPCTYFFHGTFMDPDVLQSVAGLQQRAKLHDAWVEGLRRRRGGGGSAYDIVR